MISVHLFGDDLTSVHTVHGFRIDLSTTQTITLE